MPVKNHKVLHAKEKSRPEVKPTPDPKQPIKNRKLILFDFDGTITKRDTLLEFLRFYKGTASVLAGLTILSPILTLFIAKMLPNWRAKQLMLRWFLRGEQLTQFNLRCREFSSRILPQLVRPKALHIIEQYLRDQATVVVISASAENWVAPWCEQLGIICLATQLEVADGRLTGNFCGKNCYGPEKVKRIQERFNLKDFDQIIAYGDSSGDREMFSIAHQNFFKPFRD